MSTNASNSELQKATRAFETINKQFQTKNEEFNKAKEAHEKLKEEIQTMSRTLDQKKNEERQMELKIRTLHTGVENLLMQTNRSHQEMTAQQQKYQKELEAVNLKK